MNGDQTERLSQEGECREVGECDILEAASEVARGVLEEIEALAGTTACKARKPSGSGFGHVRFFTYLSAVKQDKQNHQ